jgi:hypothetical protein
MRLLHFLQHDLAVQKIDTLDPGIKQLAGAQKRDEL